MLRVLLLTTNTITITHPPLSRFYLIPSSLPAGSGDAVLYVCMYACMDVCTYACMHTCMYACMFLLKENIYPHL